MGQQVAIVMSEVFLRRLTPSLTPFVRRQQDFRIISIHRPLDELARVLRELGPRGLITEWLPGVTDGLMELGLPAVIADSDRVYPGAASIDVDDWAVGAEAAETFLRAGYRSFACLGNGTPYSQQRIEGFRRRIGRAVPVREEPEFENVRYSEDFVPPSAGLRAWLARAAEAGGGLRGP